MASTLRSRWLRARRAPSRRRRVWASGLVRIVGPRVERGGVTASAVGLANLGRDGRREPLRASLFLSSGKGRDFAQTVMLEGRSPGRRADSLQAAMPTIRMGSAGWEAHHHEQVLRSRRDSSFLQVNRVDGQDSHAGISSPPASETYRSVGQPSVQQFRQLPVIDFGPVAAGNAVAQLSASP